MTVPGENQNGALAPIVDRYVCLKKMGKFLIICVSLLLSSELQTLYHLALNHHRLRTNNQTQVHLTAVLSNHSLNRHEPHEEAVQTRMIPSWLVVVCNIITDNNLSFRYPIPRMPRPLSRPLLPPPPRPSTNGPSLNHSAVRESASKELHGHWHLRASTPRPMRVKSTSNVLRPVLMSCRHLLQHCGLSGPLTRLCQPPCPLLRPLFCHLRVHLSILAARRDNVGDRTDYIRREITPVQRIRGLVCFCPVLSD